MIFQKIAAISLILGIVIIPKLALACPQCAQNDSGSLSFLLMLGAMILLPYPVVAGVIYLIRKGDEIDQAERARNILEP